MKFPHSILSTIKLQSCRDYKIFGGLPRPNISHSAFSLLLEWAALDASIRCTASVL